MKIFKNFVIIFLLMTINNLNANENSERNEITKNLRCLICQGQSVYDSDSEFANSMKILVDKKLDQGLSEKEIYIYFKENMVIGFCMILESIKIRIYYGYYQYSYSYLEVQ